MEYAPILKQTLLTAFDIEIAVATELEATASKRMYEVGCLSVHYDTIRSNFIIGNMVKESLTRLKETVAEESLEHALERILGYAKRIKSCISPRFDSPYDYAHDHIVECIGNIIKRVKETYEQLPCAA